MSVVHKVTRAMTDLVKGSKNDGGYSYGGTQEEAEAAGGKVLTSASEKRRKSIKSQMSGLSVGNTGTDFGTGGSVTTDGFSGDTFTTTSDGSQIWGKSANPVTAEELESYNKYSEGRIKEIKRRMSRPGKSVFL